MTNIPALFSIALINFIYRAYCIWWWYDIQEFINKLFQMHSFRPFTSIILLAYSAFYIEYIECEAKIVSCLCKPYFASIKVSSANLRVGPGQDYKVKIKYTTKGIPVLINAKYDHWRRIVDPNGTEGWLHKNQLSIKRRVMTVKDKVPLTSGTKEKSKVLAVIRKNVTMDLNEIRGNWCKVSCKYGGKKFSGWIKKSDTFGTFKDELGSCK